MESTAHKILLKNTGFITDTIAAGGKPGITTLAGNLLGEDLITQQLHAAVIGGFGGGPLSDAAQILAAVQNKIKSSSTKFGDFLKALRNSDLSDVADRLESDCREFSKFLPFPPLLYLFLFSPFLSLPSTLHSVTM